MEEIFLSKQNRCCAEVNSNCSHNPMWPYLNVEE